jgi:hypothetical protein
MWSALPDFTHSNISIKYTFRHANFAVTHVLFVQYVYKGPDRASLSLHSQSTPDDYSNERREQDEIKFYIDARYVSASEAFAHLMMWPTHKVLPWTPLVLQRHGADDRTAGISADDATSGSSGR